MGCEPVWFPWEGRGQQGPEASSGLSVLSPVLTLQLETAMCYRRETELGQLLPWYDGHRDLNFQEVIRDRQLRKGCVYLAPNPCQTLYLLLSAWDVCLSVSEDILGITEDRGVLSSCRLEPCLLLIILRHIGKHLWQNKTKQNNDVNPRAENDFCRSLG